MRLHAFRLLSSGLALGLLLSAFSAVGFGFGAAPALAAGQGVSGTVTAAVGGAAVSNVLVDVYDSTGSTVAQVTTDANGDYSAAGLAASTTGYTVCFDASGATGGSSTTGYQSQCYQNVPWLPSNGLPSGTTAVPVASGQTVTGINAALIADGGISGTVTAASGGGAVSNVTADVYESNGNYVTQAVTDTNGNYSITGLSPSSTGYTVCFDASGATGGSSTTGYQSQCYENVAWSPGGTLPAGTTAVPVTAGQVASGINAALIADGGISGTVTAASGGGAVSSVTADVYDSNGNYLAQAVTDTNGDYSITGLAPSATGYTVCFDATNATGGSSTTGYQSQCYQNVAWSPGGTLPTGTTAVPVSAGTIAPGINAALIADGGISGTVTAASGGGAVSSVTADVYDSNGNYLAQAVTDPNGDYSIAGLAPSTRGYTVCFDATSATGGSSTTGYQSQCYQNAAWTPGSTPPAGIKTVPVTAGQVASGINAALIADGGISGTVTAASGGGAVSSVTADVYDSNGNYLAQAVTDTNGDYSITGLAPSATGYTVCFDATSATGGSSTTGYQSQCYQNVAWTPGSTPPTGTRPVPVSVGTTTPSINAALIADGGISGKVTAATGGGAVSGVYAYVYASTGNYVAQAVTDTNGDYSITGLAPSATGYTVCFDATNATGGSSTTGYQSQCYQNVPWSPGSALPTGTTAVPVSVGTTTPSINAALIADGGISGKVTAATGGGAVSGVYAYVYASTGNYVAQAVTDTNGDYSITGLAPSATGYTVCFDASGASGGSSTTGYQSQCYKNVPWSAGSTPPSGITAVPVTAGQVASGINAALIADGGISGTVTAASGGGGISGVYAYVYNSAGTVVGQAVTDSSGTYSVASLTPSAAGFTVCFDAFGASGGSSTTGYQSQCYKNVPWSPGSTPPSGITAVPVTAGQVASGINAALIADGGISGTVTAASGGGGISGVYAYVYASTGSYVAQAVTDSNGNYSITSLTPSTTGYTVCFDASSASGGSSTTGYQSQCYQNVPWTPGNTPPTGTTAVPVSAGTTATSINAALIADGGISGTVTAASGGAGISGVYADIYDASGDYLTAVATDSSGNYSVIGLTPSAAGYTVCFDATDAADAPATGFGSQCYQNVGWAPGTPLPSGTTVVPVAAGTTVTGINAALVPAAGISGTVTAAAGGGGVGGVNVDVYDSAGNYVTATTTDSSGGYTVPQLPPSATGYAVCFDATNATGGGSTTGYQSQCYQNVPWTPGNTPPSGSTLVPVALDQDVTGISVALAAAGGISGTVTAASGGGPVANVTVRVFDSENRDLGEGLTSAAGTYSIIGLAPSATGYAVCFDATAATGGGSTTGYASQCYDNVPWTGGYVPASGATPVPVSSGTTATGIDAPLAAAGAIAGTVTASGGGGLANVQVDVTDSAGDYVAQVDTDSSGQYSVNGLAASATGYTVCFDATSSSGGASVTGYASQCYKNVPWTPGTTPPAGTTSVPVSLGKVTSGVSAALIPQPGISGTVTSAATGAAVAGVQVRIFDAAGLYLNSTATSSTGSYAIAGLAPSSGGYVVCFDASQLSYASQCYNKVSWPGGYIAPTNAAPVELLSSGPAIVNASLPNQGAISGTVTAPGTGSGVAGVSVDIYDGTGTYLTSATTGPDGSYTVSGLAASKAGYHVCFDPSTAGTATLYAGQCYKNAPWSGTSDLPAGLTAVPVVAGGTATGVGAVLVPAGSITGKVTAASGGGALGGVSVDVLDAAGNPVTATSTASDGTYSVTGLAPSATTGYTVCFDATDATGGASVTGYSSQCYKNIPWTPGSPPPAGIKPVPVSAGKTSAGIGAALASAGAISGTATAASGGAGLAGVMVDVFNSSGNLLTSALTSSSGGYAVLGLAPSPAGYSVCFDASAATGGPSATGYQSQCYQKVAWTPGGSLPSGTKPVPVSAGKTATGINAAMAAAGAISGTVTAGSGGGVSGVTVDIYNGSGDYVTQTTTDDSGGYSSTGLVPSATGYTVCFDASAIAAAGFASQCYKNIAWTGGETLPSGTTPVPVSAGKTATGTNAVLATGGSISGTVTALTGGGAIGGVNVDIFDRTGNSITTGTTLPDGTYSVTGLPASAAGYTVCFDASAATGGTSKTGYADQCYKGTAWTGGSPLPSGIKPVPVTAGGTVTGINVTLAASGVISGTVTARSGGGALAGVNVRVYDNAGHLLTEQATGANGSYSVAGLAASKGDKVCFDASAATGGTSKTGYADQCYKGTAWTGGSPLPSGIKPVPVTAGGTVTGISAALLPGGRISGTVTALTGGGALSGVLVTIFDKSGHLLTSVATAGNGTYTVVGLQPNSTGYAVCFAADFATGGSSAAGYADQCYSNVAWTGKGGPPPKVKKVPVGAGAAKTGINAKLKNK